MKLYDKARRPGRNRNPRPQQLADQWEVLVVVGSARCYWCAACHGGSGCRSGLRACQARRCSGSRISTLGQDATDAVVITEATRSVPHALCSLDNESTAGFGVLCAVDVDQLGITATSNRIRGLLTKTHPALDRSLGPPLVYPEVVDLLTPVPPASIEDRWPWSWAW